KWLPLLVFLVSFDFVAAAPLVLYTLSLHDALPICLGTLKCRAFSLSSMHNGSSTYFVKPVRILLKWKSKLASLWSRNRNGTYKRDRKSTRLNSSHVKISYAVFCLKKNKKSSTASAT